MKAWRIALVAAFVCLFLSASPASAQTVHPCDVTPVTVIQTNGAVAIGFCHDSKDPEGNPITLTNFRIAIDDTVVYTGLPAPQGTPNSKGENYYETPKTITIAKGNHSIVVFASSGDGEGDGSVPFAFTLKGLPPGKARVVSVRK